MAALGERELLAAIAGMCREQIAYRDAEIADKKKEWSTLDTPLALLDYDMFMRDKQAEKALPESILALIDAKLRAVS